MKSNGWRRRGVFGAAGALAIGAAAWAFWPRAMEVEVAEARVGRFEQMLQEDGRLRAVHRYVLSAPVSGELVRPTVKVGDAVSAGELVATLLPAAPQMIDARTRRVLQARVGSAQAAHTAALAQVGQLQAQATRAMMEADRAGRLADENFVSASAREQATLSFEAQRKALEVAQAQVVQARQAVAEARAALQRAQGGDSTAGPWLVKSPLAGRVVRLHHESATTVQPGEPLMEIADTTQLEAVVDVLSSDALRVRPQAPARLSFGAGLPELPARVLRIEEQRVNLVLAPDAAPQQVALGEGFRVEATVSLEVHEGVLVVPTGALVRNGAGWSVLVAEDGRARQRRVDVADRNAELAWLRGGVTAGTLVLLYPGAGIEDGQRIRIPSPPRETSP
jgi:HlyD family secretion protein